MKYWLVGLFVTFSLIACTKQTETLQLDSIKDLYPLQAGKCFIYRMDSTSVSYGKFTTSYYLAKDSVMNTFLDNQGRPSYTIFRYLTDTLASTPYQYSNTYYAVIDKNKVEYVNNNLRFITLVNPVSTNTSWLGNSYISDFAQLHITQSTTYNDWNYQYTSTDQPFTVIKGTFPTTCTVQQRIDSSGIFNPNFLYNKTYSIEVYAKGVGLIYKDFLAYFYQPPTSDHAGYYEDGSFGIKLNLVDYK